MLGCRSLIFIVATCLTVWTPERISAFSLVGMQRRVLTYTGARGSSPSCRLELRKPNNIHFRMKLDDKPASLKSGVTPGDTQPGNIRHLPMFSRGELLRASLLASVIALAQPLLAAAASLVASQQYNRWWVFPLAPFANKKTAVSELVPDQVRSPQ